MEESCWDCLEIAATGDKAIIKKAYAKQLKFNKPDKNPEGFLKLRAAYEQALNESYWYDEEDFVETNFVETDFVETDPVADESLAIVNKTDVDVEAVEAKDIVFVESEVKSAIDSDVKITFESADEDDSAADLNGSAANLNDSPADMSNDIANLHDDVITDEVYEDYSYRHVEDSDDENSFDEMAVDEVDFNEKAIDEEDVKEVEFDHDNATFFFEYSPWVQEWQQAVENTDTKVATSDNGDQRLQTLLQSQLATPHSLDEQKDYEEALLIWFDDNSPIYALSYQLAKSYFRWDERLDHWSHNDYPWYRLEALDERYQQATYFQTPTAFNKFLIRYFPTVASYYALDSLDETKVEAKQHNIDKPIEIKRSYVFKRLFFSFRVARLAQELNNLEAELNYYIYDHPAANELTATDADSGDNSNNSDDNSSDNLTARYWQQQSALKTLNSWIFDHFIQLKDFGFIAISIAMVLGVFSLFSKQSWQSFYNDGLALFVTISIYYLFWQLQLRLFATPSTFVSEQPWSSGWRNASALLFILGYVSWLDISNIDAFAMPTSPVYFLTHLAGASLFIANSLRQSNIVVTAITWHAGLQLLILAVLIPLFVVVVGQPPYDDLGTIPISPLAWLLLAAPAYFVSVGDTYPRLEWLSNVGFKLLNVWGYLMLIGILITYAYCVDILFDMGFGFTAAAVMIITIAMAVGKTKYINTYDES